MSVEHPRIALVGCGAIAGKPHITGIRASDWTLAAVCDVARERAEAFKRQHELGEDVVACAGIAEALALDELDAVSIATPPGTHAALTIAALDAGKHVLCEKPSTLDPAENREIIAALERNPGTTVQFFSSRMRSAAARHAAGLVRAGHLGTVYRAEIQMWLPFARACDNGNPPWFGRRAMAGGGAFMDMGQYFLDQVFHILDWPAVERVSAHAFAGHPTAPGYEDWDVEDHLVAQARLAGGATLVVDTTARVNQHWRWGVRVFGTEASVVLDNTQQDKYQLITRDAAGEPMIETPGTETVPEDMVGRLADLHAILRGEARELGTDAYQALQISELCALAYRSAATGRELRMEDATCPC